MPKFWQVLLPGKLSNPGSCQDIYLSFSRFPQRILVKSRIPRIPFQILQVIIMPAIPPHHQEDCLISNPREEYGYFSRIAICILTKPLPFQTVVPLLRFQLTWFNCINLSQPKSIKCKLVITGMSCL